MMERYRSDASLLGLQKMLLPSVDTEPKCMMLSKEWLIQGMSAGYDDDEREVLEDKIDEGYNSLLRLAIRNRALVLDEDSDLWKEMRVLYDMQMKPNYIVKKVEAVHFGWYFVRRRILILQMGW